MTGVLAQTADALATTGGSAEVVVFVVVGAVSLGSALAMLLLRNPVHSALMLVLNFFTIAVLYAVLEAQFLAVIQVIVYAGAIMVLFLFVLMLLGVSVTRAWTDRIRGQVPVSMLLGVVLLGALTYAVAAPYLTEAAVCGAGPDCVGLAAANEAAGGNVRALGLLLFTDYVWPFEVTSALLVVAALGAMVLGKRDEDPADLVDQYEHPVVDAADDDPDRDEDLVEVAAGAASPSTRIAGGGDERTQGQA